MPEAKPAAGLDRVERVVTEVRPARSRALEPFDETAERVVPPLSRQDGTSLSRLVAVMQRLLAPGGCPWDREQTFESLRKYVLEEAC
jgi:uncharacterized protein YabN with tetrapyrrole methylase and pyrophosphatase domain